MMQGDAADTMTARPPHEIQRYYSPLALDFGVSFRREIPLSPSAAAVATQHDYGHTNRRLFAK
jgi:hypothetical protein